jgi:uncharacterized protein YlzI (FlbEa/FlbD family)
MSQRCLLQFVQVDGYWKAWVDPAHVVAVVAQADNETVLHLTNGRTLIVVGGLDEVADRVLGIAPEVEDAVEVEDAPEVDTSEAGIDITAARRWGRENGYKVKPSGRTPKAVIEGYRAHLASLE